MRGEIALRGVGRNFAHQLPVQPLDNPVMARQELAHDAAAPCFKRLGSKGMVGVEAHLPGDRDGLRPRDRTFVVQDADEFGDGEGRMGIVELNGGSVGEIVKVAAAEAAFLAGDDILDGGAGEDMFLQQS